MHGGDVERIAHARGVAPEAWLDFSANINPLGPPAAVRAFLRDRAGDISTLTRYPDEDARALRCAIGARNNINADAIVVANGSAALLDSIVLMSRPAKILLTTPSFSEYWRVARSHAVEVVRLPLRETEAFRIDVDYCLRLIEEQKPGLAILTNPHNPSGALTGSADLLRLARAVQAHGGIVVVDEAFIDFSIEDSLAAAAAASEHIIVLRSLTKLFAMPALRVGYAVAAPRVAALLKSHIPAWPISSIAAEAAVHALSDEVFVAQSLALNDTSRRRLAAGLAALGVAVFPSAANFLLARLAPGHPASTQLRERLIREQRIIIRDCANFEGLNDRFIRIAVRSGDENERLLGVLPSLLHSDEGRVPGSPQ